MQSEPAAHAMEQRADDSLRRGVLAANAAHAPGTAFFREPVQTLVPGSTECRPTLLVHGRDLPQRRREESARFCCGPLGQRALPLSNVSNAVPADEMSSLSVSASRWRFYKRNSCHFADVSLSASSFFGRTTFSPDHCSYSLMISSASFHLRKTARARKQNSRFTA